MRDCGWHLMGTARMGADPTTSVVDQWGRAHDVPNLFIYDGSVFVTSSGFNPTGTIMRHRLARRQDISSPNVATKRWQHEHQIRRRICADLPGIADY